MNEELKEKLDERTEIAMHIYKKLDSTLNNKEDLTRMPTSTELISLTQTIINNLGKDIRTENIIRPKPQELKISKEEIMTELYKMRDGEPAYPVEIKEEKDLIIVNKTVRLMDRELWEDVDKKVKSFGGRWYAKPKHRWEIRV